MVLLFFVLFLHSAQRKRVCLFRMKQGQPIREKGA